MQEQIQILQNQIDQKNHELDHLTAEFQHLQHFVDKYIPIRISKTCEEFLHKTLPDELLTKLELFYMQKTKDDNEYLLRDEKEFDLKKICKQILSELDLVIEKYQKLSKQKGMVY